MNYEKILKDALNSKATPFEVSSWIEEQFPELAKSEDEEIRKALINVFATHKDYEKFFGVSVEDIRAWLEKQAEHANFRNKIQVGDKVTRNEAGVLVNLSQLNRVAKAEERQGEEDSFRTETLISVIKSGGSIRPELRNEFVNWLKSLRPQNHWKPSDEQMEALDSATENCAYSEYQDCLRELIGQLKKLREE